MSEIVRSTVHADHIELVTHVPLWSSIPTSERATEEDLASPSWLGFYRQPNRILAEAIALLRNPQCIAATANAAHGRLYTPCARPVAPGADRCKIHGGPTAAVVKIAPSSDRSVKALKREVDQLRAELAEARQTGGAA